MQINILNSPNKRNRRQKIDYRINLKPCVKHMIKPISHTNKCRKKSHHTDNPDGDTCFFAYRICKKHQKRSHIDYYHEHIERMHRSIGFLKYGHRARCIKRNRRIINIRFSSCRCQNLKNKRINHHRKRHRNRCNDSARF